MQGPQGRHGGSWRRSEPRLRALEDARASLPASGHSPQKASLSTRAGPDRPPAADACGARGRYTGYVRGLGETFAQTPVYAQLTAARPAPPHFLHKRAAGAPVPTPARDPCNYPERSKPGAPQPTLWPSLQQHGAPGMVRVSGAGRCIRVVARRPAHTGQRGRTQHSGRHVTHVGP